MIPRAPDNFFCANGAKAIRRGTKIITHWFIKNRLKVGYKWAKIDLPAMHDGQRDELILEQRVPAVHAVQSEEPFQLHVADGSQFVA